MKSAQCGPASTLFLPLPARPTKWTGTGCQSVHCWDHWKVQGFFFPPSFFSFSALPKGMCSPPWCPLTFKSFVLQLWIDPDRGLVHRERKGNTHVHIKQSWVVNGLSCTLLNSAITGLNCCLQLCWVLYCDIMCLDYDGNLLDACVTSLLAALKNSMYY